MNMALEFIEIALIVACVMITGFGVTLVKGVKRNNRLLNSHLLQVEKCLKNLEHERSYLMQQYQITTENSRDLEMKEMQIDFMIEELEKEIKKFV